MAARRPAAALMRSAPTDYSPLQRLILAFWLFDVWDRVGFGRLFEGEERRFMPRLLVGICIAAMKRRPLSITQAFVLMDTKHGRTANKYIDLAEAQGLLRRSVDTDDARKKVLVPTEGLLDKFKTEMDRLGDDMRELACALIQDDNGLPATGAPNLRVIGNFRNEVNHHVERAVSQTAFPARGWGEF